MPQIAGLRGVLPERSKLGEAIAGALDVRKGLATGALTRDPGRSVYRYHQVFAGPAGRTFTRKNLLAAVRLTPWSEGSMRPHEVTLAAGREAELATIRRTACHTSPVLAGFRDSPGEVERLLRKSEGGTPLIEVTTADGTIHRVWRVQDAEVVGKLRRDFAPKKLHVLDGHDRYEAMLAYHEELAAKQSLAMYSSANYGLACLVNLDDPTLVTAARHRILRGVTAKRDAVLAAARTHFIVDKLAGAAKDIGKQFASLADAVAHQPAFIAVFAGDADAWRLTLSPDVSAFAEGVALHRALQKLDPVVVDGLFIGRALPGAQQTTTVEPEAALAALGTGADVVVIMRPLSVEQIAHVDELGQLLPASSTAFHPPIAAGLVSLLIEPDEDLV